VNCGTRVVENAIRGVGNCRLTECILSTVRWDGIGASDTYNSGKKFIGFELDILGETLNFRFGIGKDRVDLADYDDGRTVH